MRYQMSPAEFYHVRYRFKHAISTVAREKSNALCKYHYFFSLPLLKCLVNKCHQCDLRSPTQQAEITCRYWPDEPIRSQEGKILRVP
jgi:hypothetical protein